mgnify:CR=1 FL=1
MKDSCRQLISYIAPGAPATRRPAQGNEPFMRSEIGFTPAWYRQHLDIDFTSELIDQVKAELFGRTKTGTQSETFRKGRVDSWRDELSDNLLELMDSELTELLIELDYI